MDKSQLNFHMQIKEPGAISQSLNFNTFTPVVDVFRVREIKHSLMLCQHNISAIVRQVGSLVTIPLKNAHNIMRPCFLTEV